MAPVPSFFSPRFDKAGAFEKAREAVLAKGWGKAYTNEQKLFFIPVWFFSYYVFWEKTGENGEKIVSREKRGFGALDSATSEFSEWLSHLAENASSFSSQALVPAIPDIVEVPSKLEEAPAKEIVSAGLAARNAAAKQNVLVLGMSLFFVPVWKIKGTVGEHSFSCSVEAVTGKIFFEQGVPHRKKTRKEIVNASLAEAANPLAWIEFFKRIAVRVFGAASRTLRDQDAVTLVLVAILIIAALWAMRFF
ncbi:MAG: hypothetical protein HY392_00310 [Candidatus Diapherotrites archaeon]|nr:hypothetical protein [Candidatus Diapherotrites archaeon]